ncbi:MAG TPA: hypothetical protein VL832_20655 [Puia sp.]|jgi:hypothetical protein|nr:hypothetical protein [Puia sp.]
MQKFALLRVVKNSQWIGIAAALLLIGACFLPWAYFPDLQKDFTGFFSEKNTYGRPGKVFVFLSVLAILFFLIPKVWAKRANIFVGALTIAFGIKCFLLFTACYKGICPDKKLGIFLVLIASAIMTLAAILPDIKLKERP